MRHVITMLVQNQAGVLAHIAGMFAARGFNIDSLTVAKTDDPKLSRMTVVVIGDDKTLEQVRKQLEKIITVVRVRDFESIDYVERDLLLARVSAPPEKRAEIIELTSLFRGKIVDVAKESLMIELSGTEAKLEAFIDLLRPYGLKELAHTGVIAMQRARQTNTKRQKNHSQNTRAINE